MPEKKLNRRVDSTAEAASFVPYRRKRISAEAIVYSLHSQRKKFGLVPARTAYPVVVSEPERALAAMRGEYVICDASSDDKNLIGGCKIDPGMLLFIRRPPQSHPYKGKAMPARALVLHLAAVPDMKVLIDFMAKMPSTAPLQVTLVGGGYDLEFTQRLIDLFAPQGAVINLDFCHGPKDVVMDIRTGLIVSGQSKKKIPFQITQLGQPARDGSLRLAYDNTFAENDVIPAPKSSLSRIV